MRLLPYLAVALPAMILATATWSDWRNVWRDAEVEMTRTAEALAEYGTRMLTGYVIMTGRMNELLRGMDDERIRLDETRLHQQLAGMLAELPQADASYVLDRNGEPLVSGKVHPVPRGVANAVDRDFYITLSGPNPPALHVSQLYIGRFDNLPFFAISRRRVSTGNLPTPSGFDGLVNISVRPGMLAERFRAMLGGETDSAALLRDDGQMLVRSHGTPMRLPTVGQDSQFMDLVRNGRPAGAYQAISLVNREPVLVAVRRLEGFPLYASVVRPRAAIIAAWREALLAHLYFGGPATLALFLLSLRLRRDHGRLLGTNVNLEQRVAQRTAELADLSQALDLSASFIMRPDGTILHWSRGCERLYGYAAAEVERRGRQMLTNYRPGEREAILAAVERHGEWRGELRQRHKDGSPLVVLSHWMAQLGQDGPRLVLSQTDITAQARLQAALADSEARFRATFEQAAIGMAHVGLDGRWLRVNDKACEILGRPREELMRLRFHDVTHPEDLESCVAQVQRLLAGEVPVIQEEKRYLRPDGQVVWGRLTASLLRNAAGRPLHFISAIDDITERKRAEAENALLTREVDHRAKNALAVVQAALRLTKADSKAEFLRAVEGRVGALARAHTVLAQRRWEGAELHNLLQGELAPFIGREGGPRVELQGPAVTLAANATQALCLALHELATNAVKYGALSQASGRVLVRWQLGAGRLRLVWEEQGGPPPPAVPTRRGFGSRVIEQTVQGQLGGRLERFWTPAGLRCEIEVPHGKPPAEPPRAPPLAPQDARPLAAE